MKTLNKLVLGAGIFGATALGNVSKAKAQNVDSMKISFECFDENHNKVSCFKDKDILSVGFLKHSNHSFVRIGYIKHQKELKISVENMLQIENSKGEYLGCSGKHILEVFWINYDSNLINYLRQVVEHEPAYEKGPEHIEKNLTKNDIKEKFGEDFVNRVKEIINAREDSLSFANLIKKEYKRWRIIKDDNGKIFSVTPFKRF